MQTHEHIHPLVAFRASRGLSREQLAVRLGVSRVSIFRIETGRQRPSWEMVRRITEATDGEITANDFAASPTKGAA